MPYLYWGCIGGAINVATHWSQIGSLQDGLVAFGIGAVAGAVGVFTGGAAVAAYGSASIGAVATVGAISTAYSDPILSIGNTIYFSDAPLTPEKYVMNVAMGAAMAVGLDQVGKLFRGYWLQSGNMNGGIKPRGPIEGSTENVAFYAEVEGVEVTATKVKPLLNVTKRETKLLAQYNSVESIIQDSGKLTRLKGGIKQGFVKGDATDIFTQLAKQYGAKIQTNGAEMFFNSGNVRVGLHSSVRGGGIFTLHINNAGQLFKIRIIQ